MKIGTGSSYKYNYIELETFINIITYSFFKSNWKVKLWTTEHVFYKRIIVMQLISDSNQYIKSSLI